MLKLENVSKKRNSFRLANISFELPKGYIMGLIGENGAGKTTLLNILSGLYAMDSGAMFFEGKPYSGDEESIRQEIGVIVHGDLFEGNQSLLGNAQRYGQFYVNYDQTLLKSYGERFGLDLRKKYKRLSKGEKLKFALAFALSHQPKLLLLDEPTANFDQDFRKEFQEILRDCIKTGENSVILSTHIMSDIDKFADYLLMLKKGRREEYVQKMLHVEILAPIGITLLWDIAALFIKPLSVYVFIMQMVSVLVTTYTCGALNNKGNMYGEENKAVYGKDVTLAGTILCLCHLGAVIMFDICISQVDRRDFIMILSLQILLSLPGVVWIRKRWKTIRARIADYETAAAGKDSAHA